MGFSPAIPRTASAFWIESTVPRFVLGWKGTKEMTLINLVDKTLFGNEAAEDEPEHVFESYVVDRVETSTFLDRSRPIQVVRAYKGEGKSALLRLVGLRIRSQKPAPLVVATTGVSLSPQLTSLSSDEWIRAWKQKILHLAACEIGATISVAFGDDAIALVEEAEANGFKARSFVGTILDRLRIKALGVEKNRVGGANPEELLKRWTARGDEFWFIIDDIDVNFENTPTDRLKVATFFIAVRHVANLVPEFRFRLAIRPTTWAVLKPSFEGLSHVEQYMVDLRWSTGDYYVLLARRVEGYLRRNKIWEDATAQFDKGPGRQRHLIGLVFDDAMPWGKETTSAPTEILETLSRNRPRWLIELCRLAAESAAHMSKPRISYEDIECHLELVGRRRIDDMAAEFRAQCPQVADLVTAFAQQNEWFTTDKLMNTIKNRVLQSVHPQIAGVHGQVSARDVAAFLYQIGFLTARRDLANGGYEHVSFAQNPLLLSTATNIDQGCSWEIHPIFRKPLRLKNVRRDDWR
jgi:hypothetical protein